MFATGCVKQSHSDSTPRNLLANFKNLSRIV